jgi:amino acid transporter
MNDLLPKWMTILAIIGAATTGIGFGQIFTSAGQLKAKRRGIALLGLGLLLTVVFIFCALPYIHRN